MAEMLDERTAALLEENGKRVRVVCLSGPIKIHLPDDEHEHDNNDTVHHEMPAHDTHHAPESLPKETQDAVPAKKKFDCNNPDDTMSPFCPYIPGNEICLKETEENVLIKAVIIKTFPATLSCCMVIRFVDPPTFNGTSECVLKLFDRRFSTQQREDWGAAPWSPAIEKAYQEFVDCGDAEEFFSYWDAERERMHNWSAAEIDKRERWSPAKLEAYLQWESTSTYDTENRTYEQMAHLQGKDVPKVFGQLDLVQSSADPQQQSCDKAEANDDDNVKQSRIFLASSEDVMNLHTVLIPGILMEWVDGFHLTDLHMHLPKEYWQSTVDSAIDALHNIQGCGIVNRDLNTRSFVVDPLTRNVMMIDFGMVAFREICENDREWDSLQMRYDEEGKVGCLMEMYLERRGGGRITYKPSERTHRLRWRFRREEGEHEGGTAEEDEFVRKCMAEDVERAAQRAA